MFIEIENIDKIDLVYASIVALTLLAVRPPRAATPRVLNIDDPTTVPIPISDSVMKVPIILTNSSGADVAIAIKVAAATSCKRIYF